MSSRTGHTARPRTDRSSAQRERAAANSGWALARLRLHPQVSLVPEMGKDEYRSFAHDVASRGISVPLEITSAGVVLNGRHRLRAASELGCEQVPVRVVDPPDEVEHILLSALSQRHLSASQRAALAIELEQVQREAAEAHLRQRANLRRGARAPEVAALPPRGEKTRDLIAALAGVSPRTAQDALTVSREDRALFELVKAGTIAAPKAARRVRQRQRDRALPPAPPLPEGPFDLIYADPPWQLGNPEGAHAPDNHYPTLPPDEMKAFAIPAAEDAVLFLWAVNMLLPQALEVMAAWGFTYKGQLVWVKESPGQGNWVRIQHELLLIGIRGHFRAPDPEDRPTSVVQAQRGRHSEKPACVYELIERMYPQASKLELFARGKPRRGWHFWGNEVEAARESEDTPADVPADDDAGGRAEE